MNPADRAVASLKLKSAQLDGALIVLSGGRSDFNGLQAQLALRQPAFKTLREDKNVTDLKELSGTSCIPPQ